MAKEKKKKTNKNASPKKNIQELRDSRDGGQIALRGYSYQLLYSCYLVLSNLNSNVYYELEGVEDIDRITQKESDNAIIHIQLKYSTDRQNASFLHDVLKNFIEAYLLDQNRSFKLVYDFPVAKGNLSKLFESKLDSNSITYWNNVISKIQQNNPDWNWSAYDFEQFISCLSFEKIEKATLVYKVEKALIETYEITTDNISLFTNSIKIHCFEKMEHRGCISKSELDILIQSVKNDISKGFQNPAHSWIQKLDYSISNTDKIYDFYEGKKATPTDIANELPVKRPMLEHDIVNSIQENTITVIKSSSGQGKTTLALQAAYSLHNEYTPYQLLWCDDVKELGNIAEYFKARIKLGEKPLILIDNLDSHLTKWNHLAQLLQSELRRHYKLLITSRESDWYNYSGDLSNIKSLKIIKPVLEEKEAAEIFDVFKKSNRLHPSVTNWQKAWNKVAEKQLLIEYVYLLTHGEMLSERIASQISQIGNSPSGKAKCEILRKVCFADICGIKIHVAALVASQSENLEADFGEMLKSMESEFLVHVNNKTGYIEGLHPIRSMHIVNRLHEFMPLDNTALSVIEVAKKEDYPVLFSHLPEHNLDKAEFFSNIIEILWNENDLSNFFSIIQGLFSGSVMQYFHKNQSMFDDANSHGGLFIISTEMCPFASFKEFDDHVETIDKILESFPNNANIKYLSELRDKMPICDLRKTPIYTFCSCLYRKLLKINVCEIGDLDSYAVISEWIYNIDEAFNLSVNFPLKNIWSESDKLSLDCVSTLMYTSFCGNRSEYEQFAKNNLDSILTYLKHQTKSHKIYVDFENNSIHVEYVLRLRDIESANEESVSRLKYICRTLPIFELYCSDAIKPTFNFLSTYTMPDDAHKKMPIRNIVIMFHQDLTSLWNKTIMSNYEFDTVTEWLDYWFDSRKLICLLADKFCAYIFKILSGKAYGNLATEVDDLRKEFSLTSTKERKYPKEGRPFEDKARIPEGLVKIKINYFQSMQNFNTQFVGFIARNPEKQRFALVNLTAVQSSLKDMQSYFTEVAVNFGVQERNSELCIMEKQSIEQLVMYCNYYQTHSENRFLNKFQIKDWYHAFCQKEREIAEENLSLLQSKFSVHFPNEIYTIKLLKYYPIIVDGLDMSSESILAELLINCIPFANTNFDYLVILCTNKSDEINPTALQVPNFELKKVIQSYTADDYVLPENMMLPYPVEVTLQMLNCFSEKYNLPVKENYETLPVGDIAEELWVYSKTRELLTRACSH